MTASSPRIARSDQRRRRAGHERRHPRRSCARRSPRAADVVGIEHGFEGLLEGRVPAAGASSDVGGVLDRGGTFLGTSRSARFETDEGVAEARAAFSREHGDRRARRDRRRRLVPRRRGAARTAACRRSASPARSTTTSPAPTRPSASTRRSTPICDAVGKVRDTASSHERTFVIEVMGRSCGILATYAGLACGGDCILVPEVPWRIEDVCGVHRVAACARGKKHSIIIDRRGCGSRVRAWPTSSQAHLRPRGTLGRARPRPARRVALGVRPHSRQRAWARARSTSLLAGESGVAVGLQGLATPCTYPLERRLRARSTCCASEMYQLARRSGAVGRGSSTTPTVLLASIPPLHTASRPRVDRTRHPEESPCPGDLRTASPASSSRQTAAPSCSPSTTATSSARQAGWSASASASCRSRRTPTRSCSRAACCAPTSRARVDTPIVLRVSGGNSVLDDDLSNETIITDIEECIRLNAAGMALSIFVGSPHQHQTIANLAKLVDEGERYGIPVIAVTAVGKEMVRDARYLALATRIAAEMGAHIVKTYYCEDDFERITVDVPGAGRHGRRQEAARARGAPDDVQRDRRAARPASTWAATSSRATRPLGMIKAVNAVVHGNASVDDAYAVYEDEKAATRRRRRRRDGGPPTTRARSRAAEKMPDTMRAAVYYNNSDVRIEERPVPRSAPARCSCTSARAASAAPTCWSGTASPRRRSCSATRSPATSSRWARASTQRRASATASSSRTTCRATPAATASPATTPPATRCTPRTSIPAGSPSTCACPRCRPTAASCVMPDSMSYEEGTFVEPLGVRRARAGARRRASGLDGAGGGQRHLRAAAHPARAGAGRGSRVRDRRERVPSRLGAQERRDARRSTRSPPATSCRTCCARPTTARSPTW